MPEDKIFPFVKRKTPVVDLFRQKVRKVGVEPSNLNEAQKRLADEFKRGLASALGVSPGAIRQDLVENWVVEWTKAVTKPEYWRQGQELGRQLGSMLPPRGTGLITGRAGERRAGQPRTEEERAKRHYGSDISVVK